MLQSRSAIRALAKNRTNSPSPSSRQGRLFPPFCESFNGRMRDELLNETLFLGLDHARTRIADWADDYKGRRPHSALGYLTPDGLRRQPHRNGRSARQPRPAPPIARCSPRAEWRNICRDSNRGRMKLQWQVSTSIAVLESAAVTELSRRQRTPAH
jgi:hypothetical protein